MIWTIIVGLFILYATNSGADSHERRHKRELPPPTPATATSASSTLLTVTTNQSLSTSFDVVMPPNNVTGEWNTTLPEQSMSTHRTSSRSSASAPTSTTATPATPWFASLEWIIGFAVAGSVLIVLTIASVRICCRFCCRRCPKTNDLPVFPPDHDSTVNDGDEERNNQHSARSKNDRVQYHAGNRRHTDTFRF